MLLDAYTGYSFNTFYLSNNGDYIVFNPKFYLETSFLSYLEFHFWFLSWRWNVNFIGYKYTFLDTVFQWNIDDYTSYCSSFGWETKATKFETYPEEFVSDCSYGLFGAIFERSRNCVNRRNTPSNGFYSYQFTTAADKSGYYRNYQCS